MQETHNIAIEVEGLTKRYGNLLALDNVSFEVKKGEIFGFLGPNGAGKTTTIHILATLLKPAFGSAAVFGVDVFKEPNKIRKLITLMFQADCLDSFLNVYNHLYFYTLLEGTRKAERKRRIEKVMKTLDLSSKAKASIFQLSGGLIRRLQLARIFLSEAELLFLDEPTLGIDIEGKIKIWNLLKRRCQERNLTIFLATNDMAEAEYLCDRIAFISQGKLLALGTPGTLKRETKKVVLSVDLEKWKTPGSTLNLPSTASLLSNENDRIEIELARPETDLSTIIGQISQQAVIKDLDVRKPTIQDVFLHVLQKDRGE